MGDPHLTEQMSDEELLEVLGKVEDGNELSLIELAVAREIERRGLQT